MKKTISAIAALLLVTVIHAQSISADDLRSLPGEWKGQLTYLDYSSNKEVSIKAVLKAEMKGDSRVKLNFDYPAEPGYGSKEQFEIRENGKMVNDMKVIERTELPDGSLKIVLENRGKDGNDQQPAVFHHVFELGKSRFVLSKLVKFEGQEKFFQRNQYSFNR